MTKKVKRKEKGKKSPALLYADKGEKKKEGRKTSSYGLFAIISAGGERSTTGRGEKETGKVKGAVARGRTRRSLRKKEERRGRASLSF